MKINTVLIWWYEYFLYICKTIIKEMKTLRLHIEQLEQPLHCNGGSDVCKNEDFDW